MLVVADVLALATTFFVVELIFGTGSGATNRFGSVVEYLLLLVTLPGWIVIAKLYGLYDQDEERTHHATTDDFSRRLPPGHGRRLAVLRRGLGHGPRPPGSLEADRLLGAGRRARHRRAVLRATASAGAASRTSRTRSSSAPATSASWSPASSCSTRSTGSTSSASSTRTRGRAGRTRAPSRLLGDRRTILPRARPAARRRAGDHRVLERHHEETLEIVRSLDDVDVQIDIVPRLFELVGPKRRRSTRSRAFRSSGCRRRGSRARPR